MQNCNEEISKRVLYRKIRIITHDGRESIYQLSYLYFHTLKDYENSEDDLKKIKLIKVEKFQRELPFTIYSDQEIKLTQESENGKTYIVEI